MGRKHYKPKIITLDTETNGLDGALRRIAIYDGKEVTYGFTFRDIEWKLEEYYQAGFLPEIYIHNADFDLRKLPEIFELGNVLWNSTCKISDKYAKLTCKKYTIHDSMKIFPKGLAVLSKDFDLEHGKLDLWEAVQARYPGQYMDHVDFLARCDLDDALYLEYLGYDVISLYELIQKLMEISKLEVEDFVRILSTASLSRYLFKNGYGAIQFKEPGSKKTDFEILTSCKGWTSEKPMKFSDVTYQQVELKIREAYTGGRTEVFRPVCGPAFYYDVNSLYPSVMINHDFPVGFPEYIDDGQVALARYNKWREDRQGLGFIKANVYVPPQEIPPLPVKLGKLAFVTGHITGTWTFTELDYAMTNCGVEIEQVQELIFFKKTYPVFKNFITTMYKLKEQATIDKNKSLREFAKLILNTAYGWTGMRRDDKTALRDISLLDKWEDTGRITYINEELGFIEIQDMVMTDTVQVQVAAYVTSYARLVLLDALRTQAKKGQVYYCDTDSMVCSAPLPDSLVDPVRLGAWDVEHHIQEAIFLQPKVYMFREDGKDNIKFKGVTKARQKQLDYDFYKHILTMLQRGETEKVEVEAGRKSLPTLAVAQKRHALGKKGGDANKLNEMNKSMDLGARQKRDIDYQANVSTPWHMESLEAFDTFSFEKNDNKPSGTNLFGG